MDSAALDAEWREKLKDETRFSLEWYEEHPITKELLKSDVLKDRWVIEFGCGIGTRAYIAQMNFPDCDITGVDGSEFAIQDARRSYKSKALEFECANLLTLPFRDNDFQSGYMLAVIEHIKDTEKLLSECKRVIEPGGKLFVSVTEKDYHRDGGHIYGYDVMGLAHDLGAVGKHIKTYVKEHVIYATVEVE